MNPNTGLVRPLGNTRELAVSTSSPIVLHQRGAFS